jgi:hypothetical protein
MKFERFCEVSKLLWDDYLSFLRDGFKPTKNQVGFFPQFIIVSRYDQHWTVELLGAQPGFKELQLIVRKKCGTISDYFNQFKEVEQRGAFHMHGAHTSTGQIVIAQGIDYFPALKRFPFLGLYETTFLVMNASGSLITFDDDFRNTLIHNCALLNKSSEAYRCKNILLLAVFRNDCTEIELKDFYDHFLKYGNTTGNRIGYGVRNASKDDESLLVASYLQNLYLADQIHETTIGAYLKDHSKVLLKAFNATSLVYEPYLKWIEHDGTIEAEAINPDFILRREDGSTVIIDLKLAKTEAKSLIKGKRSRRRPIDYVYEGITQLAHYSFYFTFDANREYMSKRYDVDVSDPELWLVVGSVENVDAAKMEQALQANRGIKIAIMDYDTLVFHFIRECAPLSSPRSLI